MVSKIKPLGLALDIMSAISGVEKEAKKLREYDTYFYDFVKRRVVELDRAFRLIDEAKVEEKSFTQGKVEWMKSAEDDSFPKADLPAGAETKKKGKYPSKSLTCWGYGSDHHL